MSPIKQGQGSKANTKDEVSVMSIWSEILEGVLVNPLRIFVFELGSVAYDFGL